MSNKLALIQGPQQPELWSKTLGALIDEQASSFGDRPAVLVPWQSVHLSYLQLQERSRTLARAMLAAGLRHGECVGIMAGNCFQYIEVFLGASRIGCPVVVLNNTYTPGELKNAVRTSSCKMVFIASHVGTRSLSNHTAALLERDSSNPSLSELQRVVYVGQGTSSQDRVEMQSYNDFVLGGNSSAVADSLLSDSEKLVAPSDVLNLQFTSGTTGSPKAATLTHRNIVNNARFVGRAMHLTPDDIVCCPPPLFHCFGLVMGFLASFFHGSSILFPSDHFDAKRVVDAIVSYDATVLLGVPTMYVAELECIAKTNQKPRRLRTGLASGSAVSMMLMDQLRAKMGVEKMLIAYGMTETSPVTFITAMEDSDEKRTATVGRPMPHTAAKIVDPQGNILLRGQRGEICTSGYALQKGYWKNEVKTREVMKRDENGVLWMSTGDEGLIDDDGYAHITGRIKDIIIRGGENIFPREIEERLAAHPHIDEASVVGIKDERYGEVVGCFLKSVDISSRPDPLEVRKFVEMQLGRHKAPQHVFWLGEPGVGDDFPKTGKETITVKPLLGPSAAADDAVSVRPPTQWGMGIPAQPERYHYSAMQPPSPAVRIVEVGPRDGLQNISQRIPTATKLELIRRLQDTGLQTIELTSVVSPRAIPQLADCRQLLQATATQQALQKPALRLPVLVPNVKGFEIAQNHGVKEIAVFISATEGFSKANINCTVDEGIGRAKVVASRAANANIAVRGYVSCIFADPYDGPTPPSAVLRCVQELLQMGCYEVSLGDTLGVGSPSNVRRLIQYLTENGIPLQRLAGHFHDTYGGAVANVWEAYQCGIRVFDSSVAGLGGCPFAPGARGNVASEDIVYMFQNAGIETGVDLLKLVATGSWISHQLSMANSSRAGTALAVKNKITATPDAKPSTNGSWTLAKQTEGLELYRSGVNLKIVLNRPKNGNALTAAMIADLTNVINDARNDQSISRIVLTANGKFFCTGMDLGKESTPVGQGGSTSDAQFHRLTNLFEAIDQSPKVTIACLNGPAFGGGVGLAFACDIRLCANTAAVTLSEVKLGLCAATISKYVIREFGLPFAREALLSARPISATELKSRGVITEVARDQPHLQQLLDDLLSRMKVASPNASRMSKELVRLAWAHGGGETQATGIKAIFDAMMRPDADGAYGVKQFQGGKKVDWDEYIQQQQKLKAKL
ncbi:hypothetical protein FE257_007119 [Aspergillus nanangensis]|uniref:hydroxymethylglutaryl-CoA lyase n=1 Tax=Aspergillus nanangensis TaxID=2582783 RepID=A0AAD4CN91_ASPNN|nr:hypothetical protein FE257_007119 [Aspergillus nanangensis]